MAGQTSEYSNKDLTREARATVKGRGRYIGWTLEIFDFKSGRGSSVSLKVRYHSRELGAEQVRYVAI